MLVVPLFSLFPDLDFTLGAKIMKYHSKKYDIDIYILKGSPRYHRSVLTHSHLIIIPFFLYIFFFSSDLTISYIMAAVILGVNSHLILDLIPYKVPEELYTKPHPQWEVFKYRFKAVFKHDITGVLKSWWIIKINVKNERRRYYVNILFGFMMFALLICQNVYFTTIGHQENLFTWIVSLF
ncbi:MAG: metal-dependent hydrolase [Candidatus Helarchaeota archaeon]